MILFFSYNCKFCIEILNLLDNTDLKDKTQMVCIDGVRNLPSFLKVVPTFFIGGNVIEGKDNCIDYIKKNSKQTTQPIKGVDMMSNLTFEGLDNTQQPDTNFSYLNSKEPQLTVEQSKMQMSAKLDQMDFNKKLEELQSMRNNLN